MAERFFGEDPNTTLIKLRQLGEVLAQRIAKVAGIPAGRDSQYQLLRRLQERAIVPARPAELFHSIREAGNTATHEHSGTHGEALHQLKLARELAVWFHRTFGSDPDFNPGAFVPPRPPRPPRPSRQPDHPDQPAPIDPGLARELERLQAELDAARTAAERALAAAEEHARARLSAQEQAEQAEADRHFWEAYAAETEARLAAQARILAQTAAVPAPAPDLGERIERAHRAADAIHLDEAATRRLIDDQLRRRGWDADSQRLTHSAGARPEPGRAMAIAEWPTASGPADYALFSGTRCVGLIEAKRMQTDVPAVLQQAKRYSRDVIVATSSGGTSSGGAEPAGGPWGEYRVPFLFATNGRPFLQQLASKSGIWFWDSRQPTQHSRPLIDWFTPQDLDELLAQDIAAADRALAGAPIDLPGLRDYQKQAIAAVEVAIAQGQRACLVSMATGTGKTRTAIALIYRLVKAGRFRRILFVVDRTALGEQTADAFKNVRLERLHSFPDIYDMKTLDERAPEPATRLHIATIQGMIRRVFPAAADAPEPEPEAAPHISIAQYDCIVVDECHRGYTLDRELGDTELGFRDQADYISMYRRLLDYFDAVKIALTATPALHTTQIFGAPVYVYSYRDAVIDGYLVDHDLPYRIVTQLGEDGIVYRAGEQVTTYDPRTRQLDLFQTPDEIVLDIESFNRKVITESFNRAVCAELARHIDPALPGKTLVFCVTRDHADMVVAALKEAMAARYGAGAIHDDAIARITGDIDRPLEMIRRFKNERSPSIAVTVDLLTTGIDVPEIVNLVFLRRIRSRILYDQMLGRATRLCPEIRKDRFLIFDCVDLYTALKPYTDMKPVVQKPNIGFEQLVRELGTVADDTARAFIRDELVAKLQALLHRIDDAAGAALTELCGAEPAALGDTLRQATPDALWAWFSAHPAVIPFLDQPGIRDREPVYVSTHANQYTRLERGYGTAAKPEDYLAGFQRFLSEQINRIPALLVVTQRPRDLTRAQLREVQQALAQAGYTELGLQSAYSQLSNQDIAASIIGHIRRHALGEPLVPYSERVSQALNKILASHPWTAPQRQWLTSIARQIEANTVVDRAAFGDGNFRAQGGFERVDRVFDGRLETILGDFHEALWQRTG